MRILLFYLAIFLVLLIFRLGLGLYFDYQAIVSCPLAPKSSLLDLPLIYYEQLTAIVSQFGGSH